MPELEERQARIEGILEQMDKRLSNVELDIKGLRNELVATRDSLSSRIDAFSSAINSRIDRLTLAMIAMWVTIILTIIFKK